MDPPLRLCVCLVLIAACSARPNWHRGVAVVKSPSAPAPFALPEYNEAQITAAQAIRDAGEDAQLHLAMMKQKYMDIVRQHFYNSLPPPPFVKESYLHSGDILPVQILPPQPLYIHHSAGNPCSGNLLNCLHLSYLSRLGKIVPPDPAEFQPCFGPSCNQIFLKPHYKPADIPRPSHVSHSKPPPKRPQKHHRICDRKRPDGKCHHQTTFWPTYATIKLNTKHHPSSTTYYPKDKKQNSLSSYPTSSGSQLAKESHHSNLPSTNKLPKNPTSVNSNNGTSNKILIETLRSNTSKLENEILGIFEDIKPDGKTQSAVTSTTIINPPSGTKSKFHTRLTSIQSGNTMSSLLETTKSNPEFKEDAEVTHNPNPKLLTPTHSFHTNEVIDFTTHEIHASTQNITPVFKVQDQKETTTFRVGPQILTESNNEEQYKMGVEGDVNAEAKTFTEIPEFVPTTFSYENKLEKMVPEINTVIEEDFDEKTKTSTVNYQAVEKETKNWTPFSEDLKQETTTLNQPSERSGIEEIVTVDLKNDDYSSTTSYDIKVLDTTEDNNVHTIATTENGVELRTERYPVILNRGGDQQFLTTTSKPDLEYFRREFDNTGTTQTPQVQLSLESISEHITLQTESTTQTSFTDFQGPTQDTHGFSHGLGREDAAYDTVNNETAKNTDSGYISQSNTTPESELSNSFLEENTLPSITDFPFELSKTEGSQEVREDPFTEHFQKPTSTPTAALDVIRVTDSGFEELFTTNNRDTDLQTAEASMEPDSDSIGLEDNLFYTPDSSTVLDSHQSLDTENKQEAREEANTNSLQSEKISTEKLENLEENLEVHSTQYPEFGLETTISYNDIIDRNSAPGTDEIKVEESTHNYDLNRPSLLARENIPEVLTSQDPLSVLTVKSLLDTVTSEELSTSTFADTEAQTVSSYLKETTAGEQESRTIPGEEDESSMSTMKTVEGWATQKVLTTGYFAETRTEISDSNDRHVSIVDDTTEYKTLKVSDETYFIQPKHDTGCIESTTPIEVTEGSTSLPSEYDPIRINDKEDVTTVQTNNRQNELLQSRENGEEETISFQGIIQSTPNYSPERDITPGTTTEIINYKSMQDTIVTEVTTLPTELRENIYESTTAEDFTDFVRGEPVTNKINTEDNGEENVFESSVTIPMELFGKTDSPGLIVNEDWAEEHTEDTSVNILTDSATSEKTATTEFFQPRIAEEEYILEKATDLSPTEIPSIVVTEGTNLIDFKSDEITTSMEATTTSNIQLFLPEVYGKTAAEHTEETSNPTLQLENNFPYSYQSGVLKFTSEIDTTTEDILNTDATGESINPDLHLELNDGLKRKERSVQYKKDEIESYPITECVLCMLGLPHGHRVKRSSVDPKNITHIENHNDETNIKSNCSTSAVNDEEDRENTGFQASTILELLPVIREGYRNNAFNDEDKKVIRSLFGDMKALMDEETFERMTESTGDLLMGDGTSRIDEIIEDIDYDSSEYEMSEKEIRLKRSRKNLHMVNDLLKKIPINLKSHRSGDFQLNPGKRVVRSTHVSLAQMSALHALLSEEESELTFGDEGDDYEYEYYEDEGDDYRDGDEYAAFEDEDDEPSFGELIKLARRHRERKSRAETS